MRKTEKISNKKRKKEEKWKKKKEKNKERREKRKEIKLAKKKQFLQYMPVPAVLIHLLYFNNYAPNGNKSLCDRKHDGNMLKSDPVPF